MSWKKWLKQDLWTISECKKWQFEYAQWKFVKTTPNKCSSQIINFTEKLRFTSEFNGTLTSVENKPCTKPITVIYFYWNPNKFTSNNPLMSGHNWNPPPLKKIESLGGAPKILLQRGDNPEKGGWCRNGYGVVTYLLLYSSIAFTVCGGKTKVSFITPWFLILLSWPCKISSKSL